MSYIMHLPSSRQNMDLDLNLCQMWEVDELRFIYKAHFPMHRQFQFHFKYIYIGLSLIVNVVYNECHYNMTVLTLFL